MTSDQAIEAARRFGPGWVAMDSGGIWNWFDADPYEWGGALLSDGESRALNAECDGWRESMEKVGE